ncbi:hypothetical protein [Kitasatospora sp. GP82]|uniref:hypothetical protein n=1 Tax=Kitasatospora sp. GP82 TaxID=3035089 RepID=UPI0024757F0C|nr:hypothetical protein [Kitasatospora sp. GP82]MDH6129997.1 hypothetical protein [Kitasatospora sp. GP82]
MKHTARSALVTAVAGTLCGTVAIGSFPHDSQPLPRVLLLMVGITTVSFAVKSMRDLKGFSDDSRQTGQLPLLWIVVGLAGLCAAASGALFLLDQSRLLWFGVPGSTAAVILLAYAAVALRSGHRALMRATQQEPA